MSRWGGGIGGVDVEGVIGVVKVTSPPYLPNPRNPRAITDAPARSTKVYLEWAGVEWGGGGGSEQWQRAKGERAALQRFVTCVVVGVRLGG